MLNKEKSKTNKKDNKKILGKRKRELGDKDDLKDFFANTNVEEVP